jgi:hypothetical protein
MTRRTPKDPRPIPSKHKMVRLDELPPSPFPVAVPMAERQGVYAHSFKCGACSLHFTTYSWRPNRHRVGTITCPECGNRERFAHWRVTLSEAPKMTLDGSAEIFRYCPPPGSQYMDDSRLPSP